MQKPITLIRNEFIETLVSTINESGLPYFVMEPIIARLLDQIREGAQRQLDIDRDAYEKYLTEQKNESEKDQPKEPELEE